MDHVIYYQLGQLVALSQDQASDIRDIKRDIREAKGRLRALEQRKAPPPAAETWIKLAAAVAMPLLAFLMTGDKKVFLDALSAILAKH